MVRGGGGGSGGGREGADPSHEVLREGVARTDAVMQRLEVGGHVLPWEARGEKQECGGGYGGG